jgi:hypothetical protein
MERKMPYRIDWFIPGRVIYRRLWGVVTEDDLRAYYKKFSDLLEAGNAPIHLIVNDGRLEQMPFKASLNTKHLQINRHPSLGWSISIGQLHFVLRWLTVLPRKLRLTRWQWFKTLEEAKNFLKKRDPTLNWQDANEALVQQE